MILFLSQDHDITLEDLPVNGGRYKDTFSEKELKELYDYVVAISKRAFGLTKQQFGSIIYNYAEAKNILHPFNTEKKTAGE